MQSEGRGAALFGPGQRTRPPRGQSSGMHLVQLLLPVYDGAGKRFERALYDRTARELSERFGGLTAYTRAPAKGLWEPEPGRTTRDDVVVYEVMVDRLDPRWWARYRAALERRFAQQELVVRAQAMRRL
jgi:hypothetical protein